MDKDLIYRCLICSSLEVVNASDHKKDGRVCKTCGGHVIPIGYAELFMKSENVIDFSITEKEHDIIVFNLLSERYAELKRKPNERDENKFKKLEYLYNFYKDKVEQHSSQR